METDVDDVAGHVTLKSLTAKTNAELARQHQTADAVSVLLGANRGRKLYGHAYGQLQQLLQGTPFKTDSGRTYHWRRVGRVRGYTRRGYAPCTLHSALDRATVVARA